MTRPKITNARVIPVADLRANPANVRKDLGDLTELTRSLKVQGCLQALLVEPRTVRGQDVWVVIDGHRRLAAARAAGIPALPCLVVEPGASSADRAQTMLAAAMHERLEPLDQARAFADLVRAGVTVEAIAAQTGYTARTVRDRIALADLPAEAQQLVADKRLTLRQARDLADELDAQRRGAAKGAALSVRKMSWLNRYHPVAAAAKAACTPAHREKRVLVGQVACGQCWERALTGQAGGEHRG